jgi:hypothetical protein
MLIAKSSWRTREREKKGGNIKYHMSFVALCSENVPRMQVRGPCTSPFSSVSAVGVGGNSSMENVSKRLKVSGFQASIYSGAYLFRSTRSSGRERHGAARKSKDTSRARRDRASRWHFGTPGKEALKPLTWPGMFVWTELVREKSLSLVSFSVR